ncbi:MAG: response regulator [Bacteroidales bacterium]|nr:response regulator [Bacteroidales bacterium]MBK7628036.1 response regulator [Bacteroidales bacterium]
MAKILIIDDETAIAIMLKKMVEKAGHEAKTASNGNEGLTMFDSFHPDLLITDIVMPDKEGLELIFDLRRKNPVLKIIAISGGGRFQYEGYLNSAKHLGANKVYQKPLDLKELMNSITELLS